VSQCLTATVEGIVDEAVARRLCEVVGVTLRACHVKKGKHKLDSSLRAYNSAARFGRWLVVRDLDHDAPCPAALVAHLCPSRAPNLCLRIAVRAVESWFLGDPANLANFLRVSKALVPPHPDSLDDPKGAVINLAVRSRRREVREDIVPAGPGHREGPAYASRIIEFAQFHWDARSAAANSNSLARCLAALDALS